MISCIIFLFPSNHPSLIVLFIVFPAAQLHLQLAFYLLCFRIFVGYFGVHACVLSVCFYMVSDSGC